MNVNVLLSSGDTDEWEGVADTVHEEGSLFVVDHIDGDEISGKIKTLTVTHMVPQTVDLPGGLQREEPMEKTQVFEVLAHYAPGMWMKAEYNQ